ncbi:uncharacterized protein BCR38DRAFT_480657 [Pseudomassariella vexata]|uniref:Uncharacterized protein n=1 Tax=Pseudomassariella vexata TaxID=1141098 RepID=A0A1Y2ED17_9PEZI|nr:uncharacterized protein BCR38DRAFT_480657 [Pseudomassariella vexata]ORY69469.1 hypothetical protein BCR38DRAFT_480657 [Pseudomassariella vexata]
MATTHVDASETAKTLSQRLTYLPPTSSSTFATVFTPSYSTPICLRKPTRHHTFRSSEQLRATPIPLNNLTIKITPKMPFFYSKHFGGRHFGTSIHASKNGVHRGPWRFSFGKFNCFKSR